MWQGATGIVQCHRCHARLAVPPVALWCECPQCKTLITMMPGVHVHRDSFHEPLEIKYEPKLKKDGSPHFDPEMIKAFIALADKNHDGSLSQEEIDQFLAEHVELQFKIKRESLMVLASV